MTPRTALAEVYGAIQADDIMAELKKAGWIVVRKDAIKLAQAQAREEANDNRKPPAPADWYGIKGDLPKHAA